MKGTRSATVGAMFLALFLAASPLLNSSAGLLPGAVKCGGRFLLLLPCMAFVKGTTGDPTNACCDNLVNLYRDEPDCLCPLLAMPPAVNLTLTLQLPVLCLNLTAGSCSELPAKSNNQVLGMNRGRRLSVGEASSVFAAAVTLIVLMADVYA